MKEDMKGCAEAMFYFVCFVLVGIGIVCVLRIASCTVGMGLEEGRQYQREQR